MATKYMCATCGFYGEPKHKSFGGKVCKKCEGKSLVPPDSPVGEKMLKEAGVSEAQIGEAITQAKKAEKRKVYFKTFVVGGLLLSFTIFMHAMVSYSDTPTPTTPDVDMTLIENSIAGLQKTGLIKKIDPSLNQAYVAGWNWASLSIEDKENVGKALAYYVAYHKGTKLYWVEIYDWNSGEKLAKYSESWGFETY